MSTPPNKVTTLYDHIRELQFRLIVCGAVIVVGGILGYMYYTPLFELLRSPLHAPLFYSSPAGSFLFVMKICLLVAIGIALPVIIYNVIMFVRPACSERLSRRRVYLTTLGSLILAALGAAFAFLIILPASIKFFVGFQVTGLHALIDAGTYLNFVVTILLSFMLVFQIPLFLNFIDHIKPIPLKRLLKLEKWVVIGAILVGVLAPFSFDPTTEALIAAPIVVLFNLSIGLIALQHLYRRKREARLSKTSYLPRHHLRKPEPIPVPTTISYLPSDSSSPRVSVEAISFHEEEGQSHAAPPSTGRQWMDIAPGSHSSHTSRTLSIPPARPTMSPQHRGAISSHRLISDIRG